MVERESKVKTKANTKKKLLIDVYKRQGHTTCYNNQAVSRAKPAAAAAGAFTYSLYAVFLRKLLQKTFRKPLDKRENLIYNIQAVTETRQRSRTLKIEQN